MIFPKGVQRLGKRDLEERVGGVKLKFYQKKHHSPKVPPNQSSFTKASRLKPHHDSSTVLLNIDAHQWGHENHQYDWCFKCFVWLTQICPFHIRGFCIFPCSGNILVQGTTRPCLHTVKPAAERAGQSLAMASTKVFLNDDYINKSVVCDTAQYNALQWFLRSLVLSLRKIAKLTTLHCESDCSGTIFLNIGSRKKLKSLFVF